MQVRIFFLLIDHVQTVNLKNTPLTHLCPGLHAAAKIAKNSEKKTTSPQLGLAISAIFAKIVQFAKIRKNHKKVKRRRQGPNYDPRFL